MALKFSGIQLSSVCCLLRLYFWRCSVTQLEWVSDALAIFWEKDGYWLLRVFVWAQFKRLNATHVQGGRGSGEKCFIPKHPDTEDLKSGQWLPLIKLLHCLNYTCWGWSVSTTSPMPTPHTPILRIIQPQNCPHSNQLHTPSTFWVSIFHRKT